MSRNSTKTGAWKTGDCNRKPSTSELRYKLLKLSATEHINSYLTLRKKEQELEDDIREDEVTSSNAVGRRKHAGSN